MNDFAKSQLMKYGWSEGKGLGKHESGITEALKPKLKFDTAGVGHRDKDWNNWWEGAFNKAANSITVESQAHGVSICLLKGSKLDNLQKETLNGEKPKSKKYGNFLKTSTLLNGSIIEENNANLSKKQPDEENITYIPLTDEELFKVCGGRTAHKGARHGLKLNGKLKRIAQQEEDFLNKRSCPNISATTQCKNIKSNSESQMINNENIIGSVASSFEEASVLKQSKSVRRKNKRRMNDLTYRLNVLCNISDSDEDDPQIITMEESKQEKNKKHRKKKKEKEKRGLNSYDIKSVAKEEVDNQSNDTSFPASQKSEEQLTKKNIPGQLSGHIDKNFDNISTCLKKKKKKKYENNQHETITDECGCEGLYGSEVKKFKRLHESGLNLQYSEKNEQAKSLDYKFQTVLSCSEVPLKSREDRDSSASTVDSLSEVAETYLKKKAYYLNAKITKKKQAKLHKKQKDKLHKLTNSLSAVHLNTEESNEDKSSKKRLKTMMEKLTTDVTTKKSLKKKKKKKRIN